MPAGLAGGPGGIERLRSLLAVALDGIAAGTARRGGPLPAGGPGATTRAVRAALGGTAGPGGGVGPDEDRAGPGAAEARPHGVLPDRGVGTRSALAELSRMLAHGTADPADPACAAHLHCPPLAVAVAADLVVSMLNPSLDSWDQSPAGTAVETEVVAALAGLVGFDPAAAGGSMTTGGTASTITALMLARDHAPAGRPVRVLCSAVAHFSVARAATLLGLGPAALVPVPVDGGHRMDPAALRSALAGLPGVAPIIVATAGTTDLGAVDPLRAVAAIAREAGGRQGGVWLHVDAAYGGGALFSDRLAGLLDGIAEADSVSLDLHKLGWQPVAAGVLLTRERAAWAPLERAVAYLNPPDDTAAGYPSLLGRSLRTTRRADCFPVAVTMRALGRDGLGALVDACHELALCAAARIDADPLLERAAPVTLTTVVFRYRATSDPDLVNARLRRRLLDAGRAVVGRTELTPAGADPRAAGAVWLKLTLLNPDATSADVDALLAAVVDAGRAEDATAQNAATAEQAAAAASTGAAAADRDVVRWSADVADAIATGTLLRCWLRETGVDVSPDASAVRVELPASGVALDVPVTYHSACGWHLFGPPTKAPQAGGASRVDAATVATLLVRELAARSGTGGDPDALARIVDSRRQIAAHLADRRAHPVDPPGTTPFLAGEQALLAGHPFHPAAKSRQGASGADLAAASPELRGSFPLHWFAADPGVLRHGGRVAGTADVPAVLRTLADDLRLPPGTMPMPAHPWQAGDVRSRAGIAALLDAGVLHDLGPAGPRWYPTSSLRTVHRPGAEVMLKLSLGMRITNARRNNLRAELELGAQIGRLLDADLAGWLRRHHPSFHVIADPAWVAVEADGPGLESGLETALRAVPFGASDRVVCVAGLLAERPDLAAADTHAGADTGDPTGSGHSALAGMVRTLAARTARTVHDVAADWFDRYLDVIAVPVLDLRVRRGLGVEAHHQNTLISLDRDGWPTAGWYRDSQGWYVTASRADEVRALVPGFGDGVPAVFDEALVDERVTYYLVVNNLLGVIGALGAAGVADEARLLRRLRTRLADLRGNLAAAVGSRAGGSSEGILDALLSASRLPCKANFATCVDGRDELVGDVASQSVYVTIPNPLVEVGP